MARGPALTIAQLFVSEVLCRGPAHDQLLSDRGAAFLFKLQLMVEVCQFFGVKKLNTQTTYHSLGWLSIIKTLTMQHVA